MHAPALRLPADRRAGVALLTALGLVPMLLAAGIAVDLSRVTAFRVALQSAADQAALAGAAAYDGSGQSATAIATANAYMNEAEAGLPSNDGVTFVATAGTISASGGGTAGYTISVSAQGSVPTTLMSLVTPSVATSVHSSALNPAITLNPASVTVGNTTQDSNTVYWYVVHKDGSLPASTDLHQMSTGNDTSPSTGQIAATAGDRIGFALCDHHNPTGEQDQQQTTWTYSQQESEGNDMSQSCALRTVVRSGDRGDDTPDAPTSCPTTAQPQATLNCQQSPGQTVTYYWNDTSGNNWNAGEGDQSFNAATYSVTCPATTAASGSAMASGSASVILTN